MDLTKIAGLLKPYQRSSLWPRNGYPNRGFFQFAKLVEYSNSCTAFQRPDITRNRHFWRNQGQKVHMIRLHI